MNWSIPDWLLTKTPPEQLLLAYNNLLSKQKSAKANRTLEIAILQTILKENTDDTSHVTSRDKSLLIKVSRARNPKW